MMSSGVMAGSVTKSQVVAFILGAVANFGLYWVVMQDHYLSMARGVIDTRDVFFFTTIILASLLISVLILNKLTHK